MTESSRYLNTFMNHLVKNRMGQHFSKVVTSSLDRRGFGSHRDQENMKRQSMDGHKSLGKRLKTESESDNDRRTVSFRVKEGSLGYSIRIMQSPRRPEQKLIPESIRFHEPTLRKMQSHMNSRSNSRDKTFSKFNSLVLNRDELLLSEFLSRRKELLRLNHMDSLLSTLTGNQNVSNLRIYKDTLKRFYSLRYMKQKITSFFDYEYIQDYDSQMGYLQTLLEFKLQEIYYLCFVMLDQNGDGLLCSNDLFIMSTASKKENQLVNRDIYKMFQYVSYYRNMRPSIPIIDVACDQERFKMENTNLKKFRLLESKKEKEREKSRKIMLESQKMGGNLRNTLIIEPEASKQGKKFVLSRKTNKHLFSFRKDEEDGQAAIKQLRKRFAETPLQSRSNLIFKINFNTFKTIFRNNIPDTYYDLLYVIGGIKVPGKDYCPLNFDALDSDSKQKAEVLVDKQGVFKQKVTKMRQTSRRSKVQRFLTQSESWRSLYS